MDIAPCLLATPYAMGYTTLGEVQAFSLPAVSILKPGSPVAVKATIASIQSAVFEISDADRHIDDTNTRLVFDLLGGSSLAAWPISFVSYLVMHKATSLFDGESQCERRMQTVMFWRWFYTSALARKLVEQDGFAAIPEELKGKVLGRLKADVLCGGIQVYRLVGADRVIRGGGLEWMRPSMGRNAICYERATPEYEPMPFHQAVEQLQAAALHIAAVEKDRFLSSSAFDDSLAVIPHMGVPMALAFSFCGIPPGDDTCALADRTLALDLRIVSAVLSGNLTRWLDPRMVALNPWMASEPYASAIGATRELVLIGTPIESDTSQIVLQLLQRHVPAASLDGLGVGGHAVLVSDTRSVVALLAATPFSFGFVPLSGLDGGLLSFASLASPFDPSVHLMPSRLAAAACAPPAQPGARGHEFLFAAGTATGCYPLTATVVLLMRREFNGTDCEQGGATIEFIEWATAAEAEAEQPEALSDVVFLSSKAPQLSAERLFQVSCDGESWLESQIQRNYLGAGLVSLVWSVSIMLVAVLLAWLVWATFHWRTTLKSSQPEFQLIILLGVGLSIASGLVATRDHEGRVPDHSVPIGGRGRYPYLDRSCVEQVWCYFLGNALIFGAMIAKLWRVTKLLVNPAMRDIRVPLPVFLRHVGALVLLHVALLTAWTVNAPPYYRIEVFDRDDLHIWHGSCDLLPAGATPYPIALLSIELALIQFGIYLCNRSRNVNPRYSEGKSIAFILWEFLQMTFIGIMVGALVYPFAATGNPITVFLVKWLAPMSVNITVTALMFVSKVFEWYNQRREMRQLALPAAALDLAKRNSGSISTPRSTNKGSGQTSSCSKASAHLMPHADGKARVSPEVSQRSEKSNKIGSSVLHEQNALNSIIGKLHEAQEARRLAEEHLLDASADLTELRERNHDLKSEKEALAQELTRLRASSANGVDQWESDSPDLD